MPFPFNQYHRRAAARKFRVGWKGALAMSVAILAVAAVWWFSCCVAWAKPTRQPHHARDERTQG